MRSIIQKEKECYLCGSTLNLECHHVLFGRGLRPIADKLGLKVWLCPLHHRHSTEGVHGNRTLDLKLKQIAQKKYEETHTRSEWMERIKRNYL